MSNYKRYYIGDVNIKSVRDFIMDNKISGEQEIFLHLYSFTDLLSEYRRTYNESSPIPITILGVKINEYPYENLSHKFLAVSNS